MIFSAWDKFYIFKIRPIIVKMNSNFLLSRWVVFAAILTGICARLALPWLGHNYDIESWKIVGKLVYEGKNVFDWTDRHNYGPGLFPIFGLAQYLTVLIPWKHPEVFHFLIACVLSLSDTAIALMLLKKVGRVAAVLFALSPISILITGYHSQVDCLAISLAFAAWLLYESDGRSKQKLILSAVFLSLSLIIKHSFIFFPIWLALDSRWKARSEKITYLIIVFGLFLVSFLPFCDTLAAQERILKNVFKYIMGTGNSLLAHSFQAFFPLPFLAKIAHADAFLKNIFMGLMLGFGFFVMKREPHNSFYLYLIGLVVFASQMADQYLAIPIIACAVFAKNPWLILYSIIGTLFILGSPFNLYLWPRITGNPLLTSVNMNGVWWYYHCQIWLLLFLFFRYFQLRTNSKDTLP